MSGVLGSLSSWAAVAVSSLALYFAYRSSVASTKSANAAHEQIRRQEERETKEHASKFSAWLIIETNDSGHTFAKLRYVNTSDFPVYAVQIASVTVRKLFHIPLIEPTDDIRSVYLDGLSGWISEQIEYIARENQVEDDANPESASDEVYILATTFRSNPARFKNTIERSGVLIQFRDHSGRRWARDPSGNLRKSPSAFIDEWESTHKGRMQNIRDAAASGIDVGKLWKATRRINKWQTFEVHLGDH